MKREETGKWFEGGEREKEGEGERERERESEREWMWEREKKRDKETLKNKKTNNREMSKKGLIEIFDMTLN